MGDDDVKRRIFARRSVLIAAALATSTTACPKSTPCLSVSMVEDSGGADPRPLVCLSQVWMPPPDSDASVVTSIGDAAARESGIITLKPLDIIPDAGGPPPMPCLSRPMPCLTTTVPPPPPPQPCLKMAPPKVE